MTQQTRTANTAQTEDLTVYYDGACPLCRLEIDHYKAQAGADKIRFVDASDEAAPLGPDLDREQALARFHVRDPDGTLYSGAEGFAAIWEILPKWRWLARGARIPGMLWVMERGYRAFLPLRPALARLVQRRNSARARG